LEEGLGGETQHAHDKKDDAVGKKTDPKIEKNEEVQVEEIVSEPVIIVEDIVVEPEIVEVEPVLAPVESAPVKKSSSATEPNPALWSSLLDRIRDQNMSVHGLLSQAEFGGIDGDRLIVRVPYKFAADRLSDRKHRALVEQVAQDIHGQVLVLHCEVKTTEHIDHNDTEVVVSPELIDAATEVFGLEETA
jgi:hypothetical protein